MPDSQKLRTLACVLALSFSFAPALESRAATQNKSALKAIDPNQAQVAPEVPQPSPPPPGPPTDLGRLQGSPLGAAKRTLGNPNPAGMSYLPDNRQPPPGYSPPQGPQVYAPTQGYGAPQGYSAPQGYQSPPQAAVPAGGPPATASAGGQQFPGEGLIPQFGQPLPQVPDRGYTGPGFGPGQSPVPVGAPPDTGPDETRAAALEQVAFGTAYPEHEVPDRLDHLEMEVFGSKAKDMPLPERFSRLEAKLGVKTAFGAPPQFQQQQPPPQFQQQQPPPQFQQQQPPPQFQQQQPPPPQFQQQQPPPQFQQQQPPPQFQQQQPPPQFQQQQPPPFTPPQQFSSPPAFTPPAFTPPPQYQQQQQQMPPSQSPPAFQPVAQMPQGFQPPTGYQPPQAYGRPQSQTPPAFQPPGRYPQQPQGMGSAPPYGSSAPVVPPPAAIPSSNGQGQPVDQATSIARSIPLKAGAGDYFGMVSRFDKGTVARWTGFPVLVHLPGNTPDGWLRTLEQAISKWNQYVPVRVAAPAEPADIEVAWINHLSPRQLGLTNLEVFNGRMRVTVYLLRPTYYLPNTPEKTLSTVALHEFGHAMGLFGHSSVSTDIMYPVEAPAGKEVQRSRATGFSARDLNTLRKVYETPPLPPGYQSPHPMGWSSNGKTLQITSDSGLCRDGHSK